MHTRTRSHPDDAAIRYSAQVDERHTNTSHTQVCSLVRRHCGPQSRILEVGCSSGYTGAFLRALGHSVTGVEPSPPAAAAARSVLDDVYCGTFDDFARSRGRSHAFDVVIFADVLEHMADPLHALQQAAALLSADGRIVISVPNITHGGIRGLLAEGRWHYQELGILDGTHLRFFSRQSLLDLLDAAGCGIIELRRTTVRVGDMSGQFGLHLGRGTISVIEAISRDEDVCTFQFVALGRFTEPLQQAAHDNARWRDAHLEDPMPPVNAFTRARRSIMSRLRGCVRLVGLGH